MMRLARRGVLARMGPLDRLHHALGSLLPRASGRLVRVRPGDRLLDWFYAEDDGFEAALRREILLGLALLSGAALAGFLSVARAVFWVLPPPYLASDYWEQVRMGAGALATIAVGTPLLFRVQSTALAVWTAAAFGALALVLCSLLGIEYTAPIAAATTGSQFGVAAAVLRDEKPAGEATTRVVDRGAVVRSAVAVGGAALLVLTGHALTQWEHLRNRALPIGVGLTVLIVLLTAPNQVLRLQFTGSRVELREWTWRVITVMLALSAFIWLGITLAEDPAASRLLEGALFGGLASLLLLAFTPALRRASAAALSTFWKVFMPALALVLGVFTLSKPEVYRWRLSLALVTFIAAFVAARAVAARSSNPRREDRC